MRTPTIDLAVPAFHHAQPEGEIQLYTYDEVLNPGQRNVFLSLREGQVVKVKGKEGLYVLTKAEIVEVEGEDVREIKLHLRLQDEIT